MGLNFAPTRFQTSVQLLVPHAPSSSLKPTSFISSSLFTTHVHFVYRNRLKNWSFGACVSGGNSLKRSCRGNFNEFLDDESAKQAEDLTQKLDMVEDGLDDRDRDDNCKDTAYTVTEVSCDSSLKRQDDDVYMRFSKQFMPSNNELLEHSLLGIHPEPVDWPEREEIVRVNIEQKANFVGIPLSLRMLKRKLKWQDGIGDAGDFVYCSVKKAFSSLVFIIRELQSYALNIRESLYCEDLKEIINKMQREMNSSFVWLFQQVFSRTPTLMVYVMILLANFTVHSMSNNVVVAATSSSILSDTITETLSLTEEKNQEQSEVDSSRIKRLLFSISDVSKTGSQVSSRYETSAKNCQMTKEEVDLWTSVVEEASRMQEESGYRILDHVTMQHLVTPVTVKLEPDNYADYFRTDLLYQMGVAEEPNNPLLLSNYAQFLHLVARDYDRAEKCFKRAIQVEPPDAEALSRYADFLWIVRNDHWAAEETYQQAMAAEPNNSSYASKYASFLWSTGGEDTCFPLS